MGSPTSWQRMDQVELWRALERLTSEIKARMYLEKPSDELKLAFKRLEQCQSELKLRGLQLPFRGMRP